MCSLTSTSLSCTTWDLSLLLHPFFFFFFFSCNCIVPLGILPWEIQVAFPGESQLWLSHTTEPTLQARCFECFRDPPNSHMGYGIFYVHTDVNACDCTQGLYKLHWKWTLGEKFLAPVKFTAASIYSPGRTLCMCLWWSFWELWDFVFKWQKKTTLFGRGCASTKRMTNAELWTKHPQ